jgi:hypothetical protein
MMDRVNETFAYEVWVPSLNRNVMFREINTSQQKRLIKCIIDSPIYNTEFIFTMWKILKENCAENSVNVDAFTIIDKLFICLAMRSVSIGDLFELEFATSNEDNAPKVKRGISLKKVIDDAKAIIKLPSTDMVTDGLYKIECSLPTIATEYSLEKELRENLALDQTKDIKELRKTVGDAFISEIIKYIKSITITDGGNETKIELESISFMNRIALVEKIPAKLLKKVIDYITVIKKEIDKVILIKTTVKTTEKKNGETIEIDKEVEERLTIDGSFFTTS